MGVRLCKAARYRYKIITWEDFKKRNLLKLLKQILFKIIVTDGVFLNGRNRMADLKGVCDLAEKYDALGNG